MGVPGYLCLDGIELSNCRTVAYAQNGYSAGGMHWRSCSCCSDDFFLVDNNGVPYTNPTTDQAPWVSTKEPESGDWAGLVITDIQGLDISPTTRGTTERINDGAQFSRQRRNAQVITVSAVSVGRTCTAAWWGVRWLNEQLREPSCGVTCGGMDLTYYLSCPDFKGSCLIPNEPSDIDEAILPYRRTRYNVALTNGILVTDQLNLAHCCQDRECTLPVIQFELTSGDPWAYSDPVVALTDKTVYPCAGSGTCPTWYVVGDGETPTDPCANIPACEGDPVCGTVPVPPDPPLLRDPCVCDPITLTTTCYPIPSVDFSDIGQTVPYFTIKAGVDPLRGLAVRFIPRDGNQLSACDTCFEIHLPFLPAKSTWTFDASRRETFITCGGQDTAAVVSGEDGGPLTWPVFECVPTDYAMCVTVGCDADLTGVLVNASMIVRSG